MVVGIGSGLGKQLDLRFFLLETDSDPNNVDQKFSKRKVFSCNLRHFREN